MRLWSAARSSTTAALLCARRPASTLRWGHRSATIVPSEERRSLLHHRRDEPHGSKLHSQRCHRTSADDRAVCPALGAAPLAAAQEFGAPRIAKRALDRLTRARRSQRRDGRPRAEKKYGPESSPPTALDDCWAALSGWLGGWRRLPGAPQAARAGAVYDAVFHDGLAFIQLPYVEEWSESGLRLQRLAADDHEKTVVELGGKEFVTRLRAAHKTYGERLEITSAGAASDPAIGTRRPQLDAFAQSLRAYVLKVASYAEDDDPASEELVGNLLKPLVEHRARATATATDPAAPTPGGDTPKPG
nr:hypothetical protein [Deltaproteobacteria bacterium]